MTEGPLVDAAGARRPPVALAVPIAGAVVGGRAFRGAVLPVAAAACGRAVPEGAVA